jgi:Soluble NSF attachment protein, SNAP
MSAVAQKQKQKALDFLGEADKLLTKKTWFSSGKERNTEDAAELTMQAANAYKVGGFNQEAGDTYMRAGELHRDRLSNNNEAAKCFSQAGTEHFLGGASFSDSICLLCILVRILVRGIEGMKFCQG